MGQNKPAIRSQQYVAACWRFLSVLSGTRCILSVVHAAGVVGSLACIHCTGVFDCLSNTLVAPQLCLWLVWHLCCVLPLCR